MPRIKWVEDGDASGDLAELPVPPAEREPEGVPRAVIGD